MAYDVSALPAYVQENRLPLLAAAVLKGKTIEVVNRMSGVKGKAALNLVDVGVNLQDGSSCGWNASGNDKFTQRILETFMVKINKEWCWKDLIGKWTEFEMSNRIIAGDKVLDFEEFFLTEIAKKIAAMIETILWKGDNGIGITGFLGEMALANQLANQFTAATDFDKIMEAYMLIPEEVLDRAVIFCSANRFRGFVAGLTAANLYHFDPNAPTDELIIPGTNTRLIKVNGLNNSTYTDANSLSVTDVVVAADPMNLYYGYDVEDSERALDVFYDKKSDTVCLRMETNIGTQIAYPAEVIVAGD